MVKNALIETVRAVHCSRVAIEELLRSIYTFMGRFETVLSLGYDLIVYWALLAENNKIRYDRFKDCFSGDQRFDLDCANQKASYSQGRPDTTFVCYPHGNLVLAEKPQRGEWKIFAGPNFLLDRILKTWETDRGFPLFVSEDLSPQKKGRIDSSPYLRMVYYEVMGSVGDTVTIYGWDLKENDQHLIDQLFSKRKEKVAVSVYLPAVDDFEGHCYRKKKAISDASPWGHKPEIAFFDAESDGCWIHL
jgi:hypothetical protein